METQAPPDVPDPDTFDFAPTDVPFRRYWLEGFLLLLSIVTPVAVWLAYRSPDLFARSGALTVFLAACAEFVCLNRSNLKHLRTAYRARVGAMPRAFSPAAQAVGWGSFVCGLSGTIIWAYGDKLLHVP